MTGSAAEGPAAPTSRAQGLRSWEALRPLLLDRSRTRDGREVFVGLDVLRVVAALLILVYHAHSMATKMARADGVTIAAEPQWWYATIDLFFVISGFLMVHMSASLGGSVRGALVFASRRLVRIPPLYWCYTLVFALAWTVLPGLPGSTPIDATRLAKSLLFIPTGEPPIILVAWTLFLEIEFYVIFALSLLLPRRVGPFAAMLVLVVLVLLGLRPGAAQSVYAVWTDPLLLDFCLGMGVALLFFAGVTLRPAGQALLVAVAAIALMALPDLGVRNLLRPPTYGLAAAALVALATWRPATLYRGRWAVPLATLSASAYTIYLAHITFLKLTEKVWFASFHGPAACYLFILVGCVTAVAGSVVAYRLFEKPLNRALKPLALPRRPT